jgi:hypothetical protein
MGTDVSDECVASIFYLNTEAVGSLSNVCSALYGNKIRGVTSQKTVILGHTLNWTDFFHPDNIFHVCDISKSSDFTHIV